MDGEFWFAVHTQAQREALASWHLTRLGYETFWPHTWEQVRVAVPRWVKRSWFSRYLFVRTAREKIYGVNEAWGVSAVVYAAGNEPFPISDDVIKELQKTLGPGGKVYSHMPKSKFAVGDKVKGLEGWSHWGLLGEVSRVSGSNLAAKMLMFGVERDVIVPAESVEIMEAGTG